jgi:hypothetical protein
LSFIAPGTSKVSSGDRCASFSDAKKKEEPSMNTLSEDEPTQDGNKEFVLVPRETFETLLLLSQAATQGISLNPASPYLLRQGLFAGKDAVHIRGSLHHQMPHKQGNYNPYVAQLLPTPTVVTEARVSNQPIQGQQAVVQYQYPAAFSSRSQQTVQRIYPSPAYQLPATGGFHPGFYQYPQYAVQPAPPSPEGVESRQFINGLQGLLPYFIYSPTSGTYINEAV